MQLDKIHIAHIQSWVNKLAFKIVNYGVAASINKRILQYGVSMQLIPFNPAREVILPRPQKAGANRIKFIDKEDLKTFLDYMERLAPTAYNYYYDSVLYKLLLATGCRYGEAVALEWSDIDFDNATILQRYHNTQTVTLEPSHLDTVARKQVYHNLRFTLSDTHTLVYCLMLVSVIKNYNIA